MSNEIRILFPEQIYPEKISGGYLRTINLATLASEQFKTLLFGMAEGEFYEGKKSGVNLIQETKYKNFSAKLKHFTNGLLSNNYSLMNSKIVFKDFNPNESILQIENPLVYNMLKKRKIENYILDEHNVHWELSKFPNFDLKSKIYTRLASKRDKNIEIEAIENASHVLTCSESDKREIIKELPETGNKITVIPNCVDFEQYDNYIRTKQNKNDFTILFMGLLSYQPNTDAVYSICNKIAPKFGGNVQFNIVGKNPPKIDHPSNVKFLGYVEDVREHILNSDICIIPLKYGSGTRLKLLEYMAMGKPVISTSKGAEGIDYIHNKNIIIEDNINNFATIINELLSDETIKNNLGRNAKLLIKNRYDWKLYQKDLFNIYEEVLSEGK
jgi:polysaccharide biosynthesis protein PslH